MVPDNANANLPDGKQESSSSGNDIPRRSRHRIERRTSIPPQPSVKQHTLRLAVGAAIGIVVMLAMLKLAISYAERDWQKKQRQARASRIQAPLPPPPPVAEPIPSGWPYVLRSGATDRYLHHLATDRYIANHWLILGRGLSGRDHPRLPLDGLRLAMAIQGESASMRNDLGAAYLQQKRMRNAAEQFRAATQIQPGFPPALFNLALSAIAERNPAKASHLLGQYLARRPEDTAAYRLQSSLLSQLGRPHEALRMLEKFLRHQSADQPLFLEAAMLAARLGQHGNAIRYLETALNGNPIQSVVRAYQSPAFREVRLSGDGAPLAARLANRARVAYGTPVPLEEIQPLRANPAPDALLR